MSETKHTPGPWIWGNEYRGLYGAGPDNEVLSHESYEGMWLAYTAGRDANARLISAAPDLLEALIGVVDAAMGADAPREAWDKARAAIAKAEGSQP